MPILLRGLTRQLPQAGHPQPDFPANSTFPALTFLRSEWNVSPELFEAFLAWLDPNRDEAGGKYEDIRRRLIKILASRGCFCPEDLADETINRVIVKVRSISEGYRGDPGRFFGGVARNVFHEYARKRLAPESPRNPDPSEAREQTSCARPKGSRSSGLPKHYVSTPRKPPRRGRLKLSA